ESEKLDDADAPVSLMGLKIRGAEPLEKLVVCRWPQNSEARWGGTGAPGDWAYEPMDKDGAAKQAGGALSWNESPMKSGEHRHLAFTYGLGRMWEQDDTRQPPPFRSGIRLFAGPTASLTKPFPVIAYLYWPKPEQTVSLALPKGLT